MANQPATTALQEMGAASERARSDVDDRSGAAPAGAPPGKGWLTDFRRDFLSSIVVFLVALPLCMGIARACGLPAAVGIITGIVGGLIVGFLAGSPLQVSGPAAGLVVTVAD